ncbi:alanine racemase [Natronoglycomyces albus]|uniref:Alanine racemase n=2 Tax=Natronoglycomyces albus TaxID=2811108 RepID=A0A895XTF0_9ACTN|nr:alanine racemase [Natronoglycomyces albus]
MAANMEWLDSQTSADTMAVVKADGYGHGIVPTARACLAGGATWLGVATLEEAHRLRDAGITAPLLAWLISPGLNVAGAIERDIDLSVSGVELLEEVRLTAERLGRRARVHLKADTGISRGGAPQSAWGLLADTAAKYQAGGAIEVLGAWSHLACAEDLQGQTNADQIAGFDLFLQALAEAGLQPSLRHLANSAGVIAVPRTHYDLVRPGIAIYGYNPVVEVDTPLKPVMELRARVTLTKRVETGRGIGYGHTYATERETTIALAPLGYADGIPRVASNKCELLLNGRRRPIRGRVSMDQVIVEMGDDPVRPGDVATFFGPDPAGPTVDDWSVWAGTIPNEILTRIGARARRRYVGSAHL